MRIHRPAIALATAACVLLGLGIGPAVAMTSNSQPDDGSELPTHPAVVALVVVSGTRAALYCSGTLIAPTVVVTASHCNTIVEESWFIDGKFGLGVTNAAHLAVPDGQFTFPWTGTGDQANVSVKDGVFTNPLYKSGFRDDVSLQVLDHDLGVDTKDMPPLMPVGTLDELQKKKTLRTTPSLVLGYGSEQQVVPALGGPTYPDSNERRYAQLETTTVDKQTIHQAQRINKGSGGACYGDSGGPTLMRVGDVDYLAGVTSTGDMPCFATNMASRIDRQSAQDFIHVVLDSVDSSED